MKKGTLFVVGLVVMLLAALLLRNIKPVGPEEPIVTVEKKIKYGIKVTNISNSLVEQATVSVFSPLKKTSWQTLKHIDATHPFGVEHDSAGNEVLQFKLGNLPPYGSIDVVITATVDLRNTSVAESSIVKGFMHSEKFVELKSEIVQEVSTLFKDKKKEDQPREIFDWIVNNFRYQGFTSENYGAKYALTKKQGDCTEYMYSFIALARSLGIPARGYSGFNLQRSQMLLDASDYHNWSEYYNGKRWILVDAQKQAFDEKYDQYIAFRLLGDKANPYKFESSDKRLVIEMI